MIRCEFCKKETSKEGTNRCDNCWEVERRLQDMPADQIEKILRSLGFQARVMGQADPG